MKHFQNQKKVTILIKLKYQDILFENIQGFISLRHYILPYLISNDKIYQNKLKKFNGIITDNKLSSNFINNLFTFISDRILYRIINEENIMDDSKYYIEEENEKNPLQVIKKRLFQIYKVCHKYNETNINISVLKKYFPKEKEFALFLFDYMTSNKKEVLQIFPKYPAEKNFSLPNFSNF